MMDRRRLFHIALGLSISAHCSGQLPFDPEVISRLSLDGRPRSLSVRQGDVWLGYDLEQAAVFKAWSPPKGKPGLVRSDFTTKSSGKALHEMRADAVWRLRSLQTESPLAVRYLGCSHRKEHVELRWELRLEDAVLELQERVPLASSPDARVVREVRLAGLQQGQELLLPDKGWKLIREDGTAAAAITNAGWHRLILP